MLHYTAKTLTKKDFVSNKNNYLKSFLFYDFEHRDASEQIYLKQSAFVRCNS
jgi:hypothetical protein